MSGPKSLAFDGTRVWVGSEGRLNIIGLKSISTRGEQVRKLLFDGSYMWAQVSGSLTKMNLNGAVLSSHMNPGGNFFTAMAFDGANIWTTSTNELRKW
jgi:hypothetical protein